MLIHVLDVQQARCFSILPALLNLLYKSEETVNASIVKFGSSGERIGVVSARGLQHKAQRRRLKDTLQTCYDMLRQFGMCYGFLMILYSLI